jgi:hypothetical protein
MMTREVDYDMPSYESWKRLLAAQELTVLTKHLANTPSPKSNNNNHYSNNKHREFRFQSPTTSALKNEQTTNRIRKHVTLAPMPPTVIQVEDTNLRHSVEKLVRRHSDSIHYSPRKSRIQQMNKNNVLLPPMKTSPRVNNNQIVRKTARSKSMDVTPDSGFRIIPKNNPDVASMLLFLNQEV